VGFCSKSDLVLYGVPRSNEGATFNFGDECRITADLVNLHGKTEVSIETNEARASRFVQS
jgi:hypothetical protein